MKYELHVPDMTCNHCKMTIENALKRIRGVDRVRVNLESKMVGVDGEMSLDAIKQGIQEAGYTAKEQQV